MTKSFSELIDQGVLVIGDGYRAKNDELGGNGLIFLRAGHVRDTHIDFEGVDHFKAIDGSKFRGKLSVLGDVVVTTKGNSTGRIAFVTKEMPEFVYSPHLSFWRSLDESVLCQGYLRAWSRGAEFNSQLRGMCRSTDMAPYLSLTDQKRLQITLPSIEHQKKSAEILDGIETRITLLRETNATLEAIAQALFKSWFVDFDPVRAKAEGLPPQGMDAATAALFPDSFEESELGLVPNGWPRLAFTETVKIIGGGTPKTSVPEYWEGDIPWFSVVDAPVITDIFVIDTVKHISSAGLNGSSTKLLREGTTIISARGTVGRLALVGKEMAMNQSCYGIQGKADDAYFTYFSTYRLVESLKKRSHGSVFDTITTETMKGVTVIYPDMSVIEAFEVVLSPLMRRVKENLQQAQTLTQLRDTLLPRLISGQLRLPEAEKLAEQAVA